MHLGDKKYKLTRKNNILGICNNRTWKECLTVTVPMASFGIPILDCKLQSPSRWTSRYCV